MGPSQSALGERLLSEDSGDAADQLKYQVPTGWAPLPEWCRFLVRLAEKVANSPAVPPLRVALALPTRSYAAAFCTVGAVLASSKGITSEEHLAWLKSLKPGDPIAVREGGRIKRGAFEEITEQNDELYVSFRVQRQGGRHLYPVRSAFHIQPLERKTVELPKHQRGTKIEGLSSFLRELVPGNPLRFLQRSELSCVVVTQKSLFRSELENECLAIETSDGLHTGTLTEVTRVRSFMSSRAIGFRSEAVAPASELDSTLTTAPLIIFDGSRAFLKASSNWPRSHWIVLLDSWDIAFADGVAQFQQGYIQREADPPLISSLNPPSSIQFLAYLAR
jgi:hypothetical protein